MAKALVLINNEPFLHMPGIYGRSIRKNEKKPDNLREKTPRKTYFFFFLGLCLAQVSHIPDSPPDRFCFSVDCLTF